MRVRTAVWVVAANGLATVGLLAIGVSTVGGFLALIQLGFLVGVPLAIQLRPAVPSYWVVAVLAAGLSLALSAIAVQFLIWFELANGELVVVTSTMYGIGLALLLDSTTARQDVASDGGDQADTEVGR